MNEQDRAERGLLGKKMMGWHSNIFYFFLVMLVRDKRNVVYVLPICHSSK